ncbi:hypothetical protein PLESTM_000911900 [Pleodorina starrii]|nr:hypothetical protein PLESTM_000911900 [Pleodorina starrii]
MAQPTQTPVEVTRTGYQNFGSFFTENVEDLIAIPEESYVAPKLPFEPPSMENVANIGFGEPCRQLFMVDFKNWTFINHGAFGAVCRAAHQESNQWREHCEAQPLRFLDRELFPHMVRVMREMADFIGADPRDLVFVPNATTGLNVAIQAAGLRPGDTMYMLNIGYGSVKKMAQAASAAAAGRGAGTSAADGGGGGDGEAPGGINVVSPLDIVDLVSRTLPPATRLAVFDSVTSNTALVLPVAELTALCRSRGVQVLIDGAHALGQLHLDMRRGVCGGACQPPQPPPPPESPQPQSPPQEREQGLKGGAAAAAAAAATTAANGTSTSSSSSHPSSSSGTSASASASASTSAASPDYFVTNCHKWLCAPRGSAVLWVAPHRRPCVRPLVVSHGSGCGFTSDFIWDGCRDYAPYLATSSALALWRALGPDRVRAYCRDLLRRAVALLADRWGSLGGGGGSAGGGGGGDGSPGGPRGPGGGPGGRLLAPSLGMCGFMALVELPQGLAASEPATSTDAKYVQDLLHHIHSVECPVKCIQGRLFVRISVHVYNTLSDYERLAAAVERIAAAVEAGAAVAAAADEGQRTGRGAEAAGAAAGGQ